MLGSFESASREVHASHVVVLFLGKPMQYARVGMEGRGRGHACWAFDPVRPSGRACRVSTDSAYAAAFLSPFCGKYCPVVQMRMLRLREMTSQRLLSPEGEDQKAAEPWVWLWASLSFHWTACSVSVWALVSRGFSSVTRDSIPARHKKVLLN